jgi:hypothetical protein
VKKIFSVFCVCCTAFVFANDAPVFEETDENPQACRYGTFMAEDPIFEEDDEKEVACDECDGCDECEGDEARAAMLLRAQKNKPKFSACENQLHASYVSWRRFKANFGMEKLFVRFPQKPAISQSNTLLTAYAYDYGVLYSLTGYFPPIGNVNPVIWFDEVLFSVDHYPYNLISHTIFQVSNGDWIMDYVAHDYVQNLIIKGRAVVTPFNGYTLQCVKPNGSRDYFDYFIDNFWIRCDCH